MTDSPQLEDGYTRIANELLEAIIAFPFSKREYKIVWAVIRRTYGYSKKQDDMSLSQLAKDTGLDTANISKTVNELVEMQVLSKQQGQYGQVIGLNKKVSEWKVLSKQQGVVKTTIDGCQNDKGTIVKTTKELLSKQPTQKTTPKEISKRNLPKESKRARKGKSELTPIPENFAISDAVMTWAAEHNYGELEQHLEAFRLKCEAKGYRYANWDKAFMEAVRADWAGARTGGKRGATGGFPNKQQQLEAANQQAVDAWLSGSERVIEGEVINA